MNWNRIEGNWKQIRGSLKEQWGRLTENQLDVIAGQRDQLIGALQETYGIARDLAEREVMDWESRVARGLDDHLVENRKYRGRYH